MSEITVQTIPMTLARYYKRIVLIPTLFALVGLVAFAIYVRYTYKSEWLTAETLEPYELAWLIGHCLIVSCLCLTVFFNRLPDVRRNLAWSFLSWFLLPVIYFCIFLREAAFDDDSLADLLFAFSITLPYLISLTITFSQFRRSLKAPSLPTAE